VKRRPSVRPLQGILVADFSRVLAGPLCTQMLADAGARVIKVEEPGRGDETRRWGPPFAGDFSAYFLSINRGKESLTLDLKTDDGRRVAETLIARSADRGLTPALWQQVIGRLGDDGELGALVRLDD